MPLARQLTCGFLPLAAIHAGGQSVPKAVIRDYTQRVSGATKKKLLTGSKFSIVRTTSFEAYLKNLEFYESTIALSLAQSVTFLNIGSDFNPSIPADMISARPALSAVIA